MAYHAIICVFLAIGCILMIVNMVDVADLVPALAKKNSAYKKWAAKASFAVVSTLFDHNAQLLKFLSM